LNSLSRGNRIAGLAAVIFLAACSSVPLTKTDQAGLAGLYQARHDNLLSLEQWAFEGRLAVNDGQDGGSGHFNWQRHGEASSMDFHGALGRGAWRLEADRNGAVLELADGEIDRAPSVGQLVERRLGWKIPVDALSWWVKGCTAPGNWDQRDSYTVKLAIRDWSLRSVPDQDD
jgi:outer membrane lipoprotein LolB